MEIRVLRYFLETAREENMTRAAERLYISQPTMSKQLKELEKELGVKLFRRSNYNIKLTEAGMLLRERAEDGAMQHDGPVPGPVLARVRRAEPLGQHEVELKRAALPGAADGVLQMEFELRTIERAFAGRDHIFEPRGLEGVLKRLFR